MPSLKTEANKNLFKKMKGQQSIHMQSISTKRLQNFPDVIKIIRIAGFHGLSTAVSIFSLLILSQYMHTFIYLPDYWNKQAKLPSGFLSSQVTAWALFWWSYIYSHI